MAARKYTAEELIESVRLRAKVPNVGSQGYADADILRLLNEEMLNELVPWLLRQREEYLVVEERVAITAGQVKFRLPHRALGQKLRDVFLVDATAQNRRAILPRISREERPAFEDPYIVDENETFYLEGNHLVLVSGNLGTTDSLEWSFYFRPGELVLSTAARKILTVDAPTKTVTFARWRLSAWAI